MNHSPEPLVYTGACHLFGDDLPHDEGVIPFDVAIKRVMDPALLVPHLFRLVDAEFPARARPGDIVVAGRNFACGKPHFQGYIAMAAQRMGVLCDSMPYKAFRTAISKGVPILRGFVPASVRCRPGDRLEVDFASGRVRNLACEAEHFCEALPDDLVDIVRAGGTRGQLAAWLKAHPDMAMPQSPG